MADPETGIPSRSVGAPAGVPGRSGEAPSRSAGPDADRQSPSVGIGLRQPHYREFRVRRPPVEFVEVHSENFFNPHGAESQVLQAVRQDYEVSLHGVGLGLGSACGLDDAHLEQLAMLVGRINPVRVSDHASFARVWLPDHGVVHANELLPVPCTRGVLDIFCANVHRVQEALRRRILIENVSAYLSFSVRDFSEPEFLSELGRRTGCGVLLDINNLLVNALNAGEPAPQHAVCRWLDELAYKAPPGLIGEVHLAGHSQQRGLVVDDHAARVSDAGWKAFEHAVSSFGAIPALIERDTALPPLGALLAEANRAREIIQAYSPPTPDPQPGSIGSGARTKVVRPDAGPSPGAGVPDQHEEKRQRALWRMILASDEASVSAEDAESSEVRGDHRGGIAAYRNNILGHVTNALVEQFPTIHRMLGRPAFEGVCARFWRDWPPTGGDLATLGTGFPRWLGCQADLDTWPWLPDCARLDWAIWQVLFHPSAHFGSIELERLRRDGADELCLRLAPGAQLLISHWPVVTLRRLHDGSDPDAGELQEALGLPGESAWVWRQGWRVRCRSLNEVEVAWLRVLREAPNLDAALERAPVGFDFAAWLREAVEAGWLSGIDSSQEPRRTGGSRVS